MKKKFNYANLPILSLPIICVFSFLGLIIFDFKDDFFVVMLIATIYLTIIQIAGFICPIGLIFQILNENKTKFDKILLAINILVSILGILALFELFLKPYLHL